MMMDHRLLAVKPLSPREHVGRRVGKGGTLGSVQTTAVLIRDRASSDHERLFLYIVTSFGWGRTKNDGERRASYGKVLLLRTVYLLAYS